MKRRVHIIMRSDVDGACFRFLVKQKAQSISWSEWSMQTKSRETNIDRH